MSNSSSLPMPPPSTPRQQLPRPRRMSRLHRYRHKYHVHAQSTPWLPPPSLVIIAILLPSAILNDMINYGTLAPALVSAIVECDPNSPNSDAHCAEKYRPGSYCIQTNAPTVASNGTCSNPFLSGCLRNYLGVDNFTRVRVCNSDDEGGAAERGDCVESEFDYQEIRILAQNWEAPMFSSWVMQIVLSEMLGVPATIETGKADESLNFYSPGLQFTYGDKSYDYEALRVALNYKGNCHKFQVEREKNNEIYQSCAHIIPEAWNGQKKEIDIHEEDGLIEPAVGTGGIGKYSWYIPLYTAMREPLFLSYLGLAAGNNTAKRKKIAKTFLRPQTWGYFCENVTTDNCTSPPYNDREGRLIAARPPAGKSEAAKYFLPDLFNGYFAGTDENDCEMYPQSCTGHLVNIPCDGSTFAVSQADRLGIPLKSSGPLVSGGYSYRDHADIYKAANYTKSDVIVYWWAPERRVQEYQGTDAEFQRVQLPSPSVECIKSRVPTEQRCSENPADHVGGLGCDAEAHAIKKLIVSNLYEITHPGDEVSRSPAYLTLKSMQISDLDLMTMLQKWYSRNIDRWNYDARDSVCAWVAENMEILQRYIPESYPRSLAVQKFGSAASYAAMALAVIVMISVGVVFVFTWKNRTAAVFVHAQPNFLFMILFGFALDCSGAILFSTKPTVGGCIARPWFVLLGQSLQIVPFIVKVAGVNEVSRQARSMRRTTVSMTKLYKVTGCIMALSALYVLIWTLVDPHTLCTDMELTSNVNENGGAIVQITYSCASQSPAWVITSFLYQFMLLVVATALAHQNQDADTRFNESFQLAMVIYSHFLFTMLGAIVWVLRARFASYTMPIASSFFLGFDALAGLILYFLPKVKGMIMPGTSLEESNTPRLSTVEQIRRSAAMRQQTERTNNDTLGHKKVARGITRT